MSCQPLTDVCDFGLYQRTRNSEKEDEILKTVPAVAYAPSATAESKCCENMGGEGNFLHNNSVFNTHF